MKMLFVIRLRNKAEFEIQNLKQFRKFCDTFDKRVKKKENVKQPNDEAPTARILCGVDDLKTSVNSVVFFRVL